MGEQRIRRAVSPGSFDPVTSGHVDVLTRAAGLFDELVVAVLHNPDKSGTFSVEERIGFLEEALAAVANVRVVAFGGRLIVDVCRELDAPVIVKGLRSETDYAYELPMAAMNRHLTGVETIFVPGDGALAHVSSSLVRQVASFGGDVTGLVPDPVRDALVARYRQA
ncbi:phosphopantetheine adenylyltransferase [Nostocoides japonicum T1-X7]|uniref:Phosphopantetheine adenylyltransferase n=1 Tax=Nostocoides japonicum T1-X7 TaxID=1194083 RepID=A0A077M783_9MICO|nr:pantetheine-phosphate adenylyltransferase [Tetrasphaera japonica]CCH79915.1 phosphopantetheine adenylyltransferase [Tetrasphaera japonica T1-X7]